jgi:D-cysteine desulfhydrase
MSKEGNRAEEALASSEQELRLLVDAIPALLWRAAPDGDFEYVNKRMLEYLGAPLDEVIGWGWMDKVHPDDVAFKVKSWLQNLESGKPLDSTRFAEERAGELRLAGHIAYVATLGGSSAVGSVGYAACALEIQAQSNDLDIDFAAVAVPNGSSGTQAGLVAGYRALGLDTRRVRSHTVLAPAAAAIAATVEKANAVLTHLGFGASVSSDDVEVSGRQLGAGYGVSTPAMIKAVRLMARQEGLLLDPVYGGKAFAGLLADISAGRYEVGDNVLFIMTGGSPGLYAYASDFLGAES